jgi:predicted RNA-binding protein with PIN domain
MGRDILVDGYNILKTELSFKAAETRNLAAARHLLITQLVNRYRHTPHQVIVVFDGDGTTEQVSHDQRIRIIFSRQGENADSVIARLAAEARSAGREVEMYSNDIAVQRTVAEQGGGVHTTGQLASQLNAAPRDVAKRAKHRMAMRRKYGLDPGYDPDDEPEPMRPPGGKKRSSHRR